jgi:hypothetical protein
VTKDKSTILLVVDAPTEVVRGALDTPVPLGTTKTKTVELSIDKVSESVTAAIAKMQDVLERASAGSGMFEITQAKFRISLDSKGEVSIFALARGGIETGASIEVTLERRSPARP